MTTSFGLDRFLQPLPAEDENVIILAMLTPSHAVDLFLGDLQRKSRSKSGHTKYDYGRMLSKFTDSLRDIYDVTTISPDDVRRFLDRYVDHSVGYQHTIFSQLNSYFKWLLRQKRIHWNPMEDIDRPRRISPEDLWVTTIATADVPKLLAAAQTHAERLAVAIPAYLGPRRNATALLRLHDFDRENGTILFREKGSKSIMKPVPDELAVMIEAAIADGSINGPDAYLVPPEGPLVRKGDRDDRVIWRLVKKVAKRAGVEAHVHALRAAFAVFYLQNNPNDLVGLQELLGHRSIETTKIYLRKLNKQVAMEPVRTLSWAAAGGDVEDPDEIDSLSANSEETDDSVGVLAWSGGGRIRTSVGGFPLEQGEGSLPAAAGDDGHRLDEALLGRVIDLSEARARLRS